LRKSLEFDNWPFRQPVVKCAAAASFSRVSVLSQEMAMSDSAGEKSLHVADFELISLGTQFRSTRLA